MFDDDHGVKNFVFSFLFSILCFYILHYAYAYRITHSQTKKKKTTLDDKDKNRSNLLQNKGCMLFFMLEYFYIQQMFLSSCASMPSLEIKPMTLIPQASWAKETLINECVNKKYRFLCNVSLQTCNICPCVSLWTEKFSTTLKVVQGRIIDKTRPSNKTAWISDSGRCYETPSQLFCHTNKHTSSQMVDIC